ncbi:MAG: TraR/DksA family transcriptional regulator [Chthoniobacterales bacterium]|nr:TraR/DksA family transcriptional regulator [Chthoniobacterales bacterium]
MIKKKTSVKKIKKTPVKKATESLKKAVKSPSKGLKKVLVKKAPVKKVAKKAIEIAPKISSKKSSTPKKLAPKMTPTEKTVRKTKALPENRGVLRQTFITQPAKKKNQILSPFLGKQKVRLLQLKDTLLDSMKGVARDNLHAGSQTSGFGMHQADAGSDAYDRDFALSILSQEQNSLYEIDEALKRIDDGTYGVCEISNKQIPRARLEARPFTRYTVECQADLEKRQHVVGTRLPVSALFGLTEEETENDEDENLLEPTKD